MKKAKRLTTSLIVPVFNESSYISTLIKSIRESSIAPDEIIFCDNNSTDDSLKEIRKFKSKLPIQILIEKEKGITPVVEKLWRNAKSDLILKVDADSVLPVNWIKNAIHHFMIDPDLMACTGTLLVSDGNSIDKTILNTGYKLSMPIYRTLRKYPLLFGPNSVFRRKALSAIDGYTWHKEGLDDQVISQKLYEAGLKTDSFSDMYMYHSSRRYHLRPYAYVETVLSFFHPRYYSVKS